MSFYGNKADTVIDNAGNVVNNVSCENLSLNVIGVGVCNILERIFKNFQGGLRLLDPPVYE